MRTKKRGVDRLLAFRVGVNYTKIRGFNDASANEKMVAKSKRKTRKARVFQGFLTLVRTTVLDSRRTTPAVIRGSESPPDSHSLPLLLQIPSYKK